MAETLRGLHKETAIQKTSTAKAAPANVLVTIQKCSSAMIPHSTEQSMSTQNVAANTATRRRPTRLLHLLRSIQMQKYSLTSMGGEL